jgi:hypothetical protein
MRNLIVGILVLVQAIAAGAAQASAATATRETGLLACSVDREAAVRFYYTPANPDHVYYPLVFRPVQRSDPRLDTVPLLPEGRTAYISIQDMRHLFRALVAVHLSWHISKAVVPFAYFKKLVALPPGVQVLVVCSKGSATAQVHPREVCNALKPLDAALNTPRALWNFQAFRFDRGCKVPGFKVGQYSEDD